MFVHAKLLWADNISDETRCNSKDLDHEWIDDVVRECWSTKPQNPNRLVARRKTNREIE